MLSRPTFIIDSREQTPLDFGDWPTVVAKLDTGDYSIQGLSDLITIERKSLQDLIGCCGAGRDRFKRELHRMQAYKSKAVVIEATYKRILGGNWRGKIKPEHVIGCIGSWGVRYNVEFVFAGDPDQASIWTKKRLIKFYDYCKEYANRFKEI